MGVRNRDVHFLSSEEEVERIHQKMRKGILGRLAGIRGGGMAAVAAVHRVCDSICGWHILGKYVANICLGDMRRRD